jgi:MFS family permease
MDETFVESASQRASDEASKYEYEMTRPQKSDASSPSPGPDEVDLVDRTPKTQPPMSLIREIAFIFICCSGQLVTQAGLGQAIPIGHIIGRSFGNPSPGELSWFAAAYSLTVGTFILIAGRVGDMIGHKTLFVYGWAWYSFWSLVAGVSVWTHSQIFFDVCRAMQGIGPAVLLPCSLALLGRSYAPGRRKEMVFALYGATAPNGFILGAVFSSIFAEWAWWPWSYWAMAVACLALGTMAYFVIPAPEDDEDDADHGPQTFDYAGAVTGIAGLVLFNVAWNQAPIVGWEKPYIIVVLVLGVLFFGIFVMVEKRVKQPLVPLDGLGGETGIVLGCIAFGWSRYVLYPPDHTLIC